MNVVEKDYITKQELCQVCNISQSTAYKLLKSGKIHFEKCCDGLLHYYKIPMSDVVKYMQEHAEKNQLSERQKEDIAEYYRTKMAGFPDALNAKHIQDITGYGKETIRKWINSRKIQGIVVHKRFVVDKDALIVFLTTPYYFSIIRRSKTHIADFRVIGLM
ncbi:MAG: helix-turn-helix domain-containing protein [Oscillospiraceae bacterium]|nr:helix-turn-helix domain-containing protein [Oscillospiraceae bacterium]